MQLEIIKDDTHIRLGLSLLEFADLLSGQAKVSCGVRRWETKEKSVEEGNSDE